MDIYHFHHFFSGRTSSRSSTWTFQLWSGPTLWRRRFSRTRYWDFLSKDELILIFALGFLLGHLGRDHQGLLRQEAAHSWRDDACRGHSGSGNKSTMSCFKFEVIKIKFPGVIECGPAWVRENLIFSVETKGRILCRPLTESLDWVSGQNLKSYNL